jgi:DNA-binding CsgD family transcriptional regulator
MDSEHLHGLRFLLLAALLLIVVGGTIDLILDQPDTWLSFHVLFETTLILGASALALTLGVGWWRAERAAEDLRVSLARETEEREAWRRSASRALEGLGQAIHAQFLEWGLSGAEEEVALLLMKGHSHKSIAKLTDRSPQTARQHASAVYRKSGLGGRAELAAFFLEDLMLPGRDGSVEQEGQEHDPKSSL